MAMGVLAWVAACQAPPPPVDAQAEPIAQAFFNEVRSGASIDDDPHVAHELKNPTSEDQIAEFRALIPAEPPQRIENRAATATTDSVGTTTRLTDAYYYADRTLIAQTALFKSPAGTTPVIVGFQLTEEAASH
jgi:hypothetical protein